MSAVVKSAKPVLAKVQGPEIKISKKQLVFRVGEDLKIKAYKNTSPTKICSAEKSFKIKHENKHFKVSRTGGRGRQGPAGPDPYEIISFSFFLIVCNGFSYE